MGIVTKNNETPVSPPVIPPAGPHVLQHLPDYNPQTPCSGCGLKSSGVMFSCKTCPNNKFSSIHLSCAKFHQACADLPKSFVHVSHGGCALFLVSASSYPGGKFFCNACTLVGDSSHYHCARCKYDLHIACAIKPLYIRHKAHPSCQLVLFSWAPTCVMNTIGFSCNVCLKRGTNQWRYRCTPCDFDLHMDCAIER